MAIDYHLELGPPNTADVVAATLRDLAVQGGVLPPDASAEALLDDGVVLRSGMWCRVTEARQSFPWPTPVEEDFGVARTCWVAFREDGDFDRNRQREEMIWIAVGLLQRLPGDAALHYENEIMWLVRKDGRLYVSDRDVNWTPERLAMLPQPYERRKLRFSDVPDPDG